MTQRSWTLLVVPHGSDSPRTFTLTERALRIASGFAAVVGIIAAIGIGVLVSTVGMPTSRIAQRENKLLSQELIDLKLRLRHLEDTLDVIGKHDERVRLLAGLPPVDSQVAQVGIGGPGMPQVSDDPLFRTNPTLGRMAFDTRIDLDKLLRRANLLAQSFSDVSDSLTKHHERYQRIPSIMPTAGWLSSTFKRSRFHPILHISRPHEGIDVSAPMGAPMSGISLPA